MREIYILIIIFLIAAGAVSLLIYDFSPDEKPATSPGAPFLAPDDIDEEQVPRSSAPGKAEQTNTFQSPMNKAGERITKKKFGDYIDQRNSPIKPERFSGYHTGVDLRFFPKRSTPRFRYARFALEC